MDLKQVMDNAEEILLDIDLLFPTQGKAFQPQSGTDVSENRFYGPEAFGVNHPAKR